ncbi:hypothetical protein F5Y17DRAFT_134815 [Xylariaceae sp. FL0594]|nr:hypothetical protein F5Y17DRAFT_134815 [Xylariaceae sp. FL0594]
MHLFCFLLNLSALTPYYCITPSVFSGYLFIFNSVASWQGEQADFLADPSRDGQVLCVSFFSCMSTAVARLDWAGNTFFCCYVLLFLQVGQERIRYPRWRNKYNGGGREAGRRAHGRERRSGN